MLQHASSCVISVGSAGGGSSESGAGAFRTGTNRRGGETAKGGRGETPERGGGAKISNADSAFGQIHGACM